MAALTGYVRKTGSDNNGGSSSGTAPDKTAADGVTAGTPTLTSATITFAAGDVDKIVNIIGKGRYRITGFTNATTVTLSGSPTAGSGLTINIGGAVLTVGALMANTTAALASGDTVYIGAGTYREVNTIQVSGVTWLGDVDGVKTSDSGKVEITSFLTDDKTAPSGTATITLNAKINLTFQYIQFVGGNNSVQAIIDGTATTSTGITFNDCSFIVGPNGAGVAGATTVFGTALNWTFDRCYANTDSSWTFLTVTLPGSASGPDYDANVIIRNSFFLTTAVAIVNGSASQFKGGGVYLYGNTIMGGGLSLGTGTSWLFPCRVFGNVFLNSSNNAVANGQIISDYNLYGGGLNTNVPTEQHSKGGSGPLGNDGSYPHLMSIGQERIWGGRVRPAFEPSAGSPLLGFVTPGADGRSSKPGTAADDSTVGTQAWTNVTNAASQNDITFATASLAQNIVSHYAKLTNFGFAIPSDATIVGIIAIGIAKAGTSARIQDQNVKLVKGGVIGGTDKGTAATKLGTANNVAQIWGSTSDLWGNTFTPTDINASTFGIAVAYKNVNVTTTTVSLDSVMLAIFYTSPSGVLSIDIRNAPRPAGGASPNVAVGALERAGTAVKETTVYDAGSVSGKIVGPGYQDFEMNVDSGSQTVGIKLRYDAPYDTTVGRPQWKIINGTECGVVDQTDTCTVSASGAFEARTMVIVPTAAGIVTVRIISRDFNGAGLVYFDTATDV